VFTAVEGGDIERLEALATNPWFDVNMRDSFGWTLLMSAAASDQLDTIEVLLHLGANLFNTEEHGNTALDIAQIQGNADCAARLLTAVSRPTFRPPKRPSLPDANTRSKRSYVTITDDDATSQPAEPYHCKVCNEMVSTNAKDHELSILHLLALEQSSTTSGPTEAQPVVPSHKPNVEPADPTAIKASNPGYQLLLRHGWTEGHGLGANAQGTVLPISTVLKNDKMGLGYGQAEAKVTHVPERRPEEHIEAVKKVAELVREKKKVFERIKISFMDDPLMPEGS
jgi:hypothetical protein